MTGTGGWAGFTRPYVINTTYNGYERLARDFYETQKELYGDVTDYYAGDFFHEIDSPPPAVFNKAEMAAKVLDCMTAYDKTGVWILQAWWSNPLPEVLKGFGDKRNTNVLILDLSSAASPKYTNTTTWGGREFGGTDWVFSILDNYGGRTGVPRHPRPHREGYCKREKDEQVHEGHRHHARRHRAEPRGLRAVLGSRVVR